MREQGVKTCFGSRLVLRFRYLQQRTGVRRAVGERPRSRSIDVACGTFVKGLVQ